MVSELAIWEDIAQETVTRRCKGVVDTADMNQSANHRRSGVDPGECLIGRRTCSRHDRNYDHYRWQEGITLDGGNIGA